MLIQIQMLALLLLVGCQGDAPDTTEEEMVPVDPPTLETPVDTAQEDEETVEDTAVVEECGPAELCARSIDVCAVDLDQATCEAWYAQAETIGDCIDIDAYTECNCGCYAAEETCDGYFACGQLCFLDHCEA